MDLDEDELRATRLLNGADKIKIEEYIRTKQGYISRVYNVDYELGYVHCGFDTIYVNEDGQEKTYVKIDNIIKHSNNIIDLIEIGDYVNGNKVLDIVDKSFVLTSSSDYGNNKFFEYQIKSIVTKERFENVKYYLK